MKNKISYKTFFDTKNIHEIDKFEQKLVDKFISESYDLYNTLFLPEDCQIEYGPEVKPVFYKVENDSTGNSELIRFENNNDIPDDEITIVRYEVEVTIAAESTLLKLNSHRNTLYNNPDGLNSHLLNSSAIENNYIHVGRKMIESFKKKDKNIFGVNNYKREPIKINSPVLPLTLFHDKWNPLETG